MKPLTPARVAILAGCMYEILAITTDRVPTITAVVKHAHKHPVGRFGVWCWLGFVAWHFLEPESDLP